MAEDEQGAKDNAGTKEKAQPPAQEPAADDTAAMSAAPTALPENVQEVVIDTDGEGSGSIDVPAFLAAVQAVTDQQDRPVSVELCEPAPGVTRVEIRSFPKNGSVILRLRVNPTAH